jgi:hypothetical protein
MEDPTEIIKTIALHRFLRQMEANLLTFEDLATLENELDNKTTSANEDAAADGINRGGGLVDFRLEYEQFCSLKDILEEKIGRKCNCVSTKIRRPMQRPLFAQLVSNKISFFVVARFPSPLSSFNFETFLLLLLFSVLHS